MAYRVEKEDNEVNAIVIDGWEKGIAPDPYSGLNRLLSVDLETPGEIAVGYGITTSTTSGGTLGKPIASSKRLFPSYGTPVGIPTGSVQSYAILDADGQVWESTSITGTWTFLSSSNSTTGSTNKDGVVYWLGYLFKTRGANIDYWNGSTWTTGWQTTLDVGVKHQMYVATNNQLYITNGNTIARVFAPDPSAFAPGTPETFDFNIAILSLPVTESALSLVEIGGGNSAQSTLLIGGSFNAIYPWDKLSTSFSLPINVADGYIGKMVAVNQNAFIFPGNTGGRGRIYRTNGSQADLYFKIPDYVFGVQDPYFEWGDVIFHNNNLIFGLFPLLNSNSTVPTGVTSRQVWALNLDTGAFRSISAIVAASLKAKASVLISAVSPSGPGFSYILGWDDNTSPGTQGIGYSGTTAGVGSSDFYTDLMPVGTAFDKRTFTQVEFKLRTPLVAGETIRIFPIVDGVEGTELSFQPTVTTGSISGVANQTFQGAQWLQFYVSMTGNSASSGVRLKEIRLR